MNSKKPGKLADLGLAIISSTMRTSCYMNKKEKELDFLK